MPVVIQALTEDDFINKRVLEADIEEKKLYSSTILEELSLYGTEKIFLLIKGVEALAIDDQDKFIPLLKEPINGKFRGEPVVPFSPRTLEFCILHMTDGEMIDHGEYVNDFEAMCRKIQEYSCYESEDWDKVIELGKTLIRQKYMADMLSNGFNME